MTETEARTAKSTPDPGSEAEGAPEKPGSSRKPEGPPAKSRQAEARRPLKDRNLVVGEVLVGVGLAVGFFAALIVGTQTDRLWPWFVVAVLAVAAVVAFVLFTRAHAAPATLERRTVPRPSEKVDPAAPRERAELAPFSVRTSLYSRHLLRLLDRSRPHGHVVIPVSGGHRAQILVEARSEHPVDIREIRPVVTERQPTRPGEPVVAAEGALPQQHFDLALDEDPPRLVPVEDREGVTLSLPLSILPNELSLIVLAPRSGKQEIAWHLEVDWVCGERNGTLEIDLGNHPFRVTPETGWTTFYPDGGPPVRAGWD